MIFFHKIIIRSGQADFAVGKLIFVLLARGGEWPVILKLYTVSFTMYNEKNFNWSSWTSWKQF